MHKAMIRDRRKFGLSISKPAVAGMAESRMLTALGRFEVHPDELETPTGGIERIVEQYWVDGMSLEDARRRALEERRESRRDQHSNAGA